MDDSFLYHAVSHAFCSNQSTPGVIGVNRTAMGFRSPFHSNICTVERYPIDQQMGKPFPVAMYTYVYPLLFVLTVIATIFVVLVLTKKNMRTSTNMVLLYMAIADLFMALLPIPFVFIYIWLGNYKDSASLKRSWCYLALYSTDALPPLCHNIAIWLTVLLAAQRLIYIRCPLNARSICTIKNIQYFTAGIVTVSAFFTLPKFLDITDMDAMEVWHQMSNGTRFESRFCVMRYTSLVHQIGGDHYFSFFYWSRVVLFVFVPSIILVVVSILLVNGIKHAKQRKDQLLQARRTRDAARQGESNATTTMLVLVVVIFLIVNLPQGTILAAFCIESMTSVKFLRQNEDEIQKIVLIDNFLIIATYPINFAIYCSMSAQFRSNFRRLFSRRVSIRGDRPMVARPRSSRRGSEGIYYRMNGFLPDGPEITHHGPGDSSPMPEISHV